MVGRELQYIAEAVAKGQLGGDGPFTRRCEQWLMETTGARRVLLVHSGTAALELAALLCGVGEGDEVIMPSFTFVSTANAFVLRGARPVFVDVSPDTLNLDERLLEAAITDKTKAVVAVHYAGVACEMDTIRDIARRHGLRVVEDAAQGLGSTYHGRALGTIGDLGCWSFHETKNLISGEGGALVVQDESLIERAEILREKGTDRSKFFRGQVDKYTWKDVGSSYVPSELVAAFLFAQFERAEEIFARRVRICERYAELLAPLEREGLLRLPIVPSGATANGHLFYVLLRTGAERDALLAHLDQAGVNAVFHYIPLHESEMGRRFARVSGELPVTESASRRLLRLPCFFDLTERQQELVCAEIRAFFQS
jgi:dTDP-4-amino-4,6-dideoxygalactose transaminase